MRPRPEKKYKEPRTPKRRRVSDIVYLMTILTAFETIGIAMLVFPRSTESITEKRELKKFPELSADLEQPAPVTHNAAAIKAAASFLKFIVFSLQRACALFLNVQSYYIIFC